MMLWLSSWCNDSRSLLGSEVKDEIVPNVAFNHRSFADDQPLLPGPEAKDHHRSGRRRTRRNRSAIHASADPVSTDGSPGHHCGHWGSVAQSGSSAYSSHARTHRTKPYFSWSPARGSPVRRGAGEGA